MASSDRTRNGRPPGIPIRNREGLRVDLARLGERAEVARRLRQAVDRDRLLLARKYPHLPQAATVWDWLDNGKPAGWPGHSLSDLAKFIRDQTGKACDSELWIRPGAASLQVCGAPRRPSMAFRGRDSELHELMELLVAGENTCVSTAIEGLPGIGKTELALNVAYAFAAQAGSSRGTPAFPRGIFWFNAENRDLTAAWDEIARSHLDIRSGTVEERVLEALRKLERGLGPALIILDNAYLGPDEKWEHGCGKPFPLPEGPRVRLLVTTRNAHFGASAFRQKHLGVLAEPAASQLLLDISGRDPERDRERLDGLGALLEQLAGHALALEVSGVYLQKNGSETPRSLLRRWLDGERLERPARHTAYAVAKSDYAATIQGAFCALWSSLDADTQRHWQLAAQFEPVPVTLELSQAVGLSLDALASLKEFHLIEWDAGGKRWSMHRLTRAFGRAGAASETLHPVRHAFVSGCAKHASNASAESALGVYLADRLHFDAALAAARDTVHGETELELLLAVGPALITHLGYAGEQAQRFYTHALEAAERSGGHEQVFLALDGLWVSCCLRGDWKAGAGVIAGIEGLARAHDCSGYWLTFFVGSALILLYTGRPAEALPWLEKGLCLVAASSPPRARTAFDNQVMLLGHAAMVQCLLGFPERGLRLADEARQRAADLGDPGTLAVTWTMRAGLHHMRGEIEAMEQCAIRVVDIATRYDLQLYLHFASVQVQWAQLAGRPPDAAEAGKRIDLMLQGLREVVRLGFGANQLCIVALVADACQRLGQRDEGLALCDQGVTIIAKNGERLFESELWRARASLANSADDTVLYLRRAVECAAKQKAPWWELRALTDLVLATDDSEPCGGAAKHRLRALCAGLAEGLELPDLQRARTALEP